MRVPADGEFRLDDEAATARMGRAIAAILGVGEAVCLTGPLGAGKSVLARALVRALSPLERDVPSPTYTLAQVYEGARFPIVHFDLYRLTSADEAFELGVAEALSDGAAVIEWAERLGHHLPPDRLDVSIEIAGEARRARLSAEGRWEGRALDL